MLNTYSLIDKNLKNIAIADGKICPDAAWLDLVEPTVEEEKLVEEYLGIAIPTREEMGGIELSNRFYEENGALYMTATVLARADSDEPGAHALTFVLVKGILVSIRYVNPTPFKTYTSKPHKINAPCNHGEVVLSGLLTAFINRLADILEEVDRQIDNISHQIFKSNKLGKGKDSSKNFSAVLKELGLSGDLISKAQESLVSIQRLVAFVQPQLTDAARKVVNKKLDSINKDSIALREHTNYLIDKITFLLDATLGMINIQQNEIMKLFSIVAVCFMPSTLVVGFFGMNFKRLPLLDWNYGFEFSLFLMAFSMVLSFIIFRRKGWI